MKHALINADCTDYLTKFGGEWDTIFADPPDNIGLGYAGYDDKLPYDDYFDLLRTWLYMFINAAETVWFSFNVKWICEVADIVQEITEHDGNYSARKTPAHERRIEKKFCVQTFTFGQHRSTDLGNNMRPIWRIRWDDAFLSPDSIRVESERQRMGDKRADTRGRVPGDVFDFTRVVGNSQQRRKWHPAQLNEGLVERCLKLTTPPGGHVLDPFAGTGTTLRVAKRCGFNCDLIELDSDYCAHIADEHDMRACRAKPPTWVLSYSAAQADELPLFGGDQDKEVMR